MKTSKRAKFSHFFNATNIAVSLSSEEDAARFLAQATLGANLAEINALAGTNYEDWLNAQKILPVSKTVDYLLKILGLAELYETKEERENNHPGYHFNNDKEATGHNFSSIWTMNLVQQPDQLRQRIAWCLSQIFVVSYNLARINRNGVGLARYYDTLSEHALGNYGDLLKAVSKHPIMTYYLSSLGNQKAIPEENQYPDENYAREVMQLFSIGLWELNNDGTQKTDGMGNPIPTYDNQDITELARVFTGLWFNNGEDFLRGGIGTNLNAETLKMFEDYHDKEAKTLFHGKAHETTLPANQLGMKDIDDACDVLLNHPNTPPFISKSLIRFLVTSNPSPAYVERVANVFIDNGSGVRGDLFSVVKAILLDTEARTYTPNDTQKGKLTEPMVRLTRLIKAFNAGQGVTEFQHWNWGGRIAWIGQWPMYSPTVFNFFQPTYSHAGELRDNGLTSPEFQILTPTTATTFANYIIRTITQDLHQKTQNNPSASDPTQVVEFKYNFTPELALADNPDALIDHLDLLLTYGELGTNTKAIIKQGIEQFESTDSDYLLKRVQTAVYLFAISPDAATLR